MKQRAQMCKATSITNFMSATCFQFVWQGVRVLFIVSLHVEILTACGCVLLCVALCRGAPLARPLTAVLWCTAAKTTRSGWIRTLWAEAWVGHRCGAGSRWW